MTHTGPSSTLSPLFAQVRDGLHMLGKFRDHQRQHGSLWPDGPHVFPQAVEENLAALSAIERHINTMLSAAGSTRLDRQFTQVRLAVAHSKHTGKPVIGDALLPGCPACDAQIALSSIEQWAADTERHLHDMETALEAIAKDDELVDANEDVFSVHAYRRCRETARAALSAAPTATHQETK